MTVLTVAVSALRGVNRPVVEVRWKPGIGLMAVRTLGIIMITRSIPTVAGTAVNSTDSLVIETDQFPVAWCMAE